MKWITVKEFAKNEGICLAAAYKRIKLGQIKSQKIYGKTVVKA